MIKNYIFTVTTGRSGQMTLYDILLNYSCNCLAEFESPTLYNNIFSGKIGLLEKKFRRKFIETEELIGRGKTLKAYEKNDIKYINDIVIKKLNTINKKSRKANFTIYFDVSKHYVRSLYVGFDNLLDKYSIVFLVRDPLLNMRSFLNRNKKFFLDNSPPEKSSNLLIMDTSGWEDGEYYLWSWVETVLRYKKINLLSKVKNSLVIRSEDLNSKEEVTNILNKLEIPHRKIKNIKRLNTNISKGYGNTKINTQDYYTLKKFVSRLSAKTLKDLGLFAEPLFIYENHI